MFRVNIFLKCDKIIFNSIKFNGYYRLLGIKNYFFIEKVIMFKIFFFK